MGNAPDRVRALEHAANLVVLLHARLDALDAALPVSAPALRRLVAQVAELARCVERLDDAGPKEEHDDWTFNRSGLVARDLWHAAAEFDFTPAQADEHAAGLLYGLAELARTLGDELGDVTLTAHFDDDYTASDTLAGIAEKLQRLRKYVGVAYYNVVVSVYDCDIKDPTNDRFYYDALLVGMTEPEGDSSSGAPATFAMTFAISDVADKPRS